MRMLPPKQQQIYDCIVSFSGLHGYPPSVREAGECVGLKSPPTIHFHLRGLEAVGLITRAGGKTRVITISGPYSDTSESMGEGSDQVPVVGGVTARAPILTQECIEDYLTFDVGELAGEHFTLRVWGESTRYAGILPGSLMVIHQQQGIHSEEIVMALFEDETTVKTLRHKGGHIWLMSENPDYEPIDDDGCTILDKVAAVVRRC